MSSKQTAVIADRDNASVNLMPYRVTVAGQPEPRVKAVRVTSPASRKVTIELTVPVIDGSPLLALSTMDATARRIAPTARVTNHRKGSRLHIREYAV